MVKFCCIQIILDSAYDKKHFTVALRDKAVVFRNLKHRGQWFFPVRKIKSSLTLIQYRQMKNLLDAFVVYWLHLIGIFPLKYLWNLLSNTHVHVVATIIIFSVRLFCNFSENVHKETADWNHRSVHLIVFFIFKKGFVCTNFKLELISYQCDFLLHFFLQLCTTS